MAKHKVLFRTTVIAFLLSVSLQLFGNGYSIKFKINGLRDTSVILGHYYLSSPLANDTAKVDNMGRGEFKGEKQFKGGMYFIYIGGKMFDFFLDDDQDFYLETDTSNLQKNLTFKGCDINEAFLEFQYKIDAFFKKRDELVKERENTSDEKKEKIDTQLKELGKKFSDIKWETIDANKDNLLGVFLKATEEIEVPDPPKDEKGNITDSLFQYRYYRKHFLDNLDVSDERLILQRITVYEEKIKKYIEKVVPQIPDTLIVECDMLIEKTRHSKLLFRFMLQTLFNTYVNSEIMGMDAVYLHLGEKYYLNDSLADWSSEKFKKELEENIDKNKSLLLGKTIPDAELYYVPSDHFKQALTDTAVRKNVFVGEKVNIYSLKAEYVVLYFWGTECGFCKKAAPKLHAMTPELKELGIMTIGVCMNSGFEGKTEWVDFVNKNELYDWINAWNTFNFDYKEKLNVFSTNQVFIIDKEKKIIAKRIPPEKVLDFMKSYIKYNDV